MRNCWWFYNLLSENGNKTARNSDGHTNFSSNGLLSDKLLHLSKWIEAESVIEEVWDTELSSEKREKASAHFCTRLSDLLDIFQRWAKFHPQTEPIRCVFFDKAAATREDLFILDNGTMTKQGKKAPVSADLKAWQEDFDRDFSEAQLQTTILDWPPQFPNVYKPPTSSLDIKHPTQRTGDRRNNPDQGDLKLKGHQQPQPARNNRDDDQSYRLKDDKKDNHAKRAAGEYLIADVPALRLKKDHPHELGATFNVANEIKEAKKTNPGFPDAPRVNGKPFCFRFMTAKCGCRTKNSGPKPWQPDPCNRIHLDLSAKGNSNDIPRDALELLLRFVQTSPLSDAIEPTPELQARVRK